MRLVVKFDHLVVQKNDQLIKALNVWCEACIQKWGGFSTKLQTVVHVHGTKCVGRIVTKSMSGFLHLCDCSLSYCATLEAWNWFVAGQTSMRVTPGHQFGQIKMYLYFQAIIFWKTLNGQHFSTDRDFDLILKLRARPEYQISYDTIYTAWLAPAFPPDRNRP